MSFCKDKIRLSLALALLGFSFFNAQTHASTAEAFSPLPCDVFPAVGVSLRPSVEAAQQPVKPPLSSLAHPESLVMAHPELRSKLEEIQAIPDIENVYNELKTKLGKEPTRGEMAVAMGEKVLQIQKRVQQLREALRAKRPFSEVYDKALEEAIEQIKKSLDGGLKSAQKKENRPDEIFSLENREHTGTINSISAKTRGEAGEIDVLARLPAPVAKSFILDQMEPPKADVEAEVRKLQNDPKFSLESYREFVIAGLKKAKTGEKAREAAKAGIKFDPKSVTLEESEIPTSFPGYEKWKEESIAKAAKESAKSAQIERWRKALEVEYADDPQAPAKVKAILSSEQDLLFNGGADWGEIKNYAGPIDLEKLTERKKGRDGKESKSILDQAIDHVRTFRAVRGTGTGEFHQFFVKGITPEAADLLQRSAPGLRVHGILHKTDRAPTVGTLVEAQERQKPLAFFPIVVKTPSGESLTSSFGRQTTTRYDSLSTRPSEPLVSEKVRFDNFTPEKLKGHFDGSRGSQFYNHLFGTVDPAHPEKAFIDWVQKDIVPKLPKEKLFFDKDPKDPNNPTQRLELTLDFNRPIGTKGVISREELDRENLVRAEYGFGPLKVKFSPHPEIKAAMERERLSPQPEEKRVKEGVENGMKGHWYNGKFYPEFGFVEQGGVATSRMTLVFEKDKTSGEPYLIAAFPGENAPALPTKIPVHKIDTTHPGSVPRETWAGSGNLHKPETLISLQIPSTVSFRFGNVPFRQPLPSEFKSLERERFGNGPGRVPGTPSELLSNSDVVWGLRLVNERTSANTLNLTPQIEAMLASRGLKARVFKDLKGVNSLELTLQKDGKPVTLQFKQNVEPYSKRQEIILHDVTVDSANRSSLKIPQKVAIAWRGGSSSISFHLDGLICQQTSLRPTADRAL